MDLIDQLTELSRQAIQRIGNLKTEEATKMALVVPFINTLGYDSYNPTEVIPEFIADVPNMNGDKVDYAIMKDQKPIMIIECKSYGTNLDKEPKKQLYKYFSFTEARIGVLTDGIVYRFHTDLEEKNKMDERPFLEINILNLEHCPINELKKLTKSEFNIDKMLPAAWDLKYIRELKQILTQQMKSPDDDYVKVLAKKTAYSGMLSQKRLEQFKDIAKKALKEFINEEINSRLKTAMVVEQPEDSEVAEYEEEFVEEDNGIVTTEEELEGYYIVKAILSQVTDSQRITHKDTKSYFNVLLDSNSWKPLCRLHLNGKKRVSFFDKENEYKEYIDSISDLYQYSSQIKRTYEKYESKK